MVNQAGDFPDGKPARRLPEAIGRSDAFLEFQSALAAVAPVERPVLLIGERGTGKELAAARLHYLSKRWQGPLVSLNSAALSPGLIESELFGHEEGAFTGAGKRRKGRFELADGGTLFLDELGLTPLAAQEKILRVTEYGIFERVGGTEAVSVDVRLVGATNSDLSALAAEGRFKEDLLDRLSFEVLHLPPLRERHGDVPILARHFAERMAMELGMEAAPEIGEEAMATLERHQWPGNVRELKNAVERAVYRSGGRRLDTIDLKPLSEPWRRVPTPLRQAESPFPALAEILKNEGLEAAREFLERTALEEALAGGATQARAAEKLKMTYDSFRALHRRLHRKG
jgi:psp operon transcriptional activator